MGEQLGIHLSTIEEIHKNMRVTKEMKEGKCKKKDVSVLFKTLTCTLAFMEDLRKVDERQ